MAEGGGFEPPRTFAPPVFKTGAINHSTILPRAIILCKMDLHLSGKTALVAAGTKGIGFAIARALAEEGVRVSLCGRTQESVRLALDQIENDAIGFPCDVTKAEEIEAWISASAEAHGPADILITNTGGPPAGTLGQMNEDHWRAGLESTLFNILTMTRLAVPPMIERGWGRVIHITSLVAKEPVPSLPISATLRAGIMALTKSQAAEWGPNGVTVNGILPGHTLTDRQLHLAEVNAKLWGVSPQEALEVQAQHSAVKRLADPTEIAAPAVFLCGTGASFITGQSLLVDGGAVRGL